ncbi:MULTISPECIES: hypothetical protein [unclassified Nocardia]|uniref:hypothetical protein n=1 Tax=unclassified Nocardia TaxID=2637762 RepID=UPI0024A9E6AE|nr:MULTISPECIES: hypothetical protein [unclassified Nocardia]
MVVRRATAALAVAAFGSLFLQIAVVAAAPSAAVEYSPPALWAVPTAPADSATIIGAFSFGNRIPRVWMRHVWSASR